MSYAIETKKRKWDRLLETFNDRSPDRALTAVPNNVSTTSISQLDGVDLGKKRRVSSSSQSKPLTAPLTTSLSETFLPSNRAAFLQRLETFRQVTKWHIPSTEPINAAVWARRGWICVDTDTVFCGSCRGRVLVKVDLEDDTFKENSEQVNGHADREDEKHDPYTAAVEVYDGIVKKFQDMIIAGHSEACPWRRRGCDLSIQRIEGLLNVGNILSTLRTRYDSITSESPDMPIVNLPVNAPTRLQKAIDSFHFESDTPISLDALRLAACGWQAKGNDILECRYCFRSLGLWLYRGKEPTMEKLDAVDSHLEYCPWRSAETQATEISRPVSGDSDEQEKELLPGWTLVCQALALEEKRRARISATSAQADNRPATARSAGSVGSSQDVPTSEITPEQREKKMKVLLKRINAARKPFNVKGLLKRKPKEPVG